MNKVLQFFKDHQNNILKKQIRVYGWQKEYDHFLISSLTKFLFEDLCIKENFAPLTNENRPGRKKPNFYITIHDTGDSMSMHDATFWNGAVVNEVCYDATYSASFQYVTGCDAIFHQIPDDEVAYHAGDSTRCDYILYETNVYGTNPSPKITISVDGYFEIDNKKTNILAPIAYKEYNGKVLIDRIAQTSDINDQGIECKLIKGKYYLGEVYFNQTYEKIANRGGNNNSIGIESCINETSDIYYTMQKTAKLVAMLLEKENLPYTSIKQHHFFSGKNCPQTMRMNGLYDHFLELVYFEHQILKFKNEGYEINLIVNDDRVLPNGRVISENTKNLKFKVQTLKDDLKEELEFEIE